MSIKITAVANGPNDADGLRKALKKIQQLEKQLKINEQKMAKLNRVNKDKDDGMLMLLKTWEYFKKDLAALAEVVETERSVNLNEVFERFHKRIRIAFRPILTEEKFEIKSKVMDERLIKKARS